MDILKILQLCCVAMLMRVSAYEMEYSSLTFRSLWQLSRVNYELHNINVATRSWIIALGIRCQPRPYRCSHAGINLFGRIHALVTQGHRQYPYTQMTHAIRMDNLIKIAKENAKASSLHGFLTSMQGPLKTKFFSFKEYITNANIDLCAITETWLKPDDDDDDDIPRAVPPLGYTLLSWPRQDGQRGGGIAIVSKSYINMEEDKDKTEHQSYGASTPIC